MHPYICFSTQHEFDHLKQESCEHIPICLIFSIILKMKASKFICACEEGDTVTVYRGIAGPDGGTTEKPVGSVWIACSQDGLVVTSQLHHFQGSRKKIQNDAVCMALKALISH